MAKTPIKTDADIFAARVAAVETPKDASDCARVELKDGTVLFVPADENNRDYKNLVDAKLV